MAVTLSDQKQVRVDQHKAITRAYTLGGAASRGDWVYLDANDKVQAALADAAGTSEVIGMIVGAADVHNTTGDYASGQTVDVCLWGEVFGFSDMTQGARIYLSDATAGASTETAPGVGSFVKDCGYPVRSDVLFVAPGSTAAAGS